MNRIVNRDGTWHRRNGVNGCGVGILPWTPANTTTTCWYDSTDESTITISTGVSEWRDKSGNNNTTSQATAGNQPGYVLDSIQNKMVLTFDGTKRLTHSYAQSSTNISIFAIVSVNASTGVRGIYTTAGTTTTQSNLVGRFTNGCAWGCIGSSSAERTAANVIQTMNWQMIGMIRSTSGTFYLNGNTNNTFTDSVGQNATGHIGGVSGQGLGGRIGEIIVVNTNVSATIRQQIEGYLAHKWNLTRMLPSTHPFIILQPNV